MRRRAWMAAAAVALGAATRADAPAASLAPAPTEYEVKAAYLYNFAKFVEWPEEAFSDPSAPFVVAVLGSDPFGRTLDEMLAGKSVAGHPVRLRRCARPEEARKAHIVFVAADASDVRSVLRQVAGRGVLTVGDGARFADQGGIIGFLVQARRVRFEINLQQAERARLKVSSQLLKLAHLVPAEN